VRPEYVPHEYQVRTIERVIRQPFLGQLLDPGLGKTSITLEAFRQLRNACDVDRLLVIAPLRVCYSVWPREAAKWRQFEELKVHVLHGDGKDPRYIRSRAADVYVINPEGLPWLVEHKDDFPLGDTMLAVDESTKFKRISSERSKNLRRLLGDMQRRNFLTGTPAPNGLEDLHGQMFIADRGATLSPHIGHYREEHFVAVPTGPQQRLKWKVRRGHAEKIYEKIAPWVVRLDARDYLEMPEKVQVTVEVDLPPAAMDLYKELRAEMILELEAGSVIAFNAGSLTGKCRQISNGSVYYSDEGTVTTDGRTARRSAKIHSAKDEALASIVEELQGQPLLVAFEHKHELPAIRAALRPIIGHDAPSIDGSCSAKQGDVLERKWNRKELPVLCVHPLSAAHGLNLQEGGNHLAWYSITWDLELHDQLVGRVWRQGQTERTFIYYLVGRDTIDETITERLIEKAGVQQDLLDALKSDLGLRATTQKETTP